MSKQSELIVLTDVVLITVVVQRGVADHVVQVAVEIALGVEVPGREVGRCPFLNGRDGDRRGGGTHPRRAV